MKSPGKKFEGKVPSGKYEYSETFQSKEKSYYWEHYHRQWHLLPLPTIEYIWKQHQDKVSAKKKIETSFAEEEIVWEITRQISG